MDKIVKEERLYLLNMAKKIKKAKCNVLLIQKSILRDAVNDLSLHFLAKLGILAIKDIERDEVEFICKSTGCKPIADIDSFTEDKLGSADLVEEVQSAGGTVAQAHLREGGVPQEIVSLAEDMGVGLIVVGSRGHGGIRRALMGSVSDAVVRHAHCPVVVMRDDKKGHA